MRSEFQHQNQSFSSKMLERIRPDKWNSWRQMQFRYSCWMYWYNLALFCTSRSHNRVWFLFHPVPRYRSYRELDLLFGQIAQQTVGFPWYTIIWRGRWWKPNPSARHSRYGYLHCFLMEGNQDALRQHLQFPSSSGFLQSKERFLQHHRQNRWFRCRKTGRWRL